MGQRIHLLQNWFSLSDPAMERELYETTSMRQFARLTLSTLIPEVVGEAWRTSSVPMLAIPALIEDQSMKDGQ